MDSMNRKRHIGKPFDTIRIPNESRVRLIAKIYAYEIWLRELCIINKSGGSTKYLNERRDEQEASVGKKLVDIQKQLNSL